DRRSQGLDRRASRPDDDPARAAGRRHPKTPPGDRSDMITLDGRSLTIEQLAEIARDPSVQVTRSAAANARVAKSEALIRTIVDKSRRSPDEHTYGVTTGFGEFKDKAIPPEELEQLQRNLLLSHSIGICGGDGAYFDAEVVRGALVTRLN